MSIRYKQLFRLIIIFVCFLSMLSLLCHHYENFLANDLSRFIIRFHVRANSDSSGDQLLKMKVKEEVVSYLNTELDHVNSLEEAEAIIKNKTDNITAVAKDVVLRNGYRYDVVSNFDYSVFPDKYYGDVKFPAGNYKSLIIEIGSGEGHNWWCVLYPPLCFIDASTGYVPDDSKALIESSVSTTEFHYMTTTDSDNSNNSDGSADVTYKFKYLSFLNDLFH